MSLLITTAQAALLAAAGTGNYPIIAWENLAAAATLSTGSGTASTTGPASNAVTGSTYDAWEGTPTDDTVALQAAFSPAVDADFIAIAAHNLSDISAGAVPQEFGTSRTNLHPRSQDFSTGWGLSEAGESTLTDAAAVSPYGGVTAGEFVCSTTASALRRLYASTNIVVSAASNYTASIFIKAIDWTWVGVALAQGTPLIEVAASGRVNLATGETTLQAGTSITAEDYGNGWWRIILAGTTGASTAYRLSVSLLDADKNVGVASTGVVGAGVYAWGAQIEAGTAHGSYIPTTTASASSQWNDLALPIVPTAGEVMAWHFETVSNTNFRVRISTSGTPDEASVGVFFVGNVMQMPRPFYQGFAPVITPTEVELQSNVSAGGHLLGSSVTKRGSRIAMEFTNIPDTFFRADDWKGFQTHFNEGGGAFVAWRPTKYADDVHYFWRDGGALRPMNSGPRDLMSVGIEGRIYEP